MEMDSMARMYESYLFLWLARYYCTGLHIIAKIRGSV